MAAVSVGTPHFSRSESETLLKLTNGRRRHPDVDFYVSIGRDTLREIEHEGLLAPLLKFGVEFTLQTRATYLKPIMRVRPGLVMTNSAMGLLLAPGNLGVRRRIRNLVGLCGVGGCRRGENLISTFK